MEIKLVQIYTSDNPNLDRMHSRVNQVLKSVGLPHHWIVHVCVRAEVQRMLRYRIKVDRVEIKLIRPAQAGARNDVRWVGEVVLKFEKSICLL